MTNMTPALELEKLQQPAQSVSNDEIDLREVGRTLGRHRRLIAGVTGAMVLISGLYLWAVRKGYLRGARRSSAEVPA